MVATQTTKRFVDKLPYVALLRLLDPNVVKDQKEIKEKEESNAI
jgi:hypothetical protein